MSEPNPFDSPVGKQGEPQPKKWWHITVVEMIVVVLILFILAGLLMPAVKMANTSPRRNDTASNLKQIGIALHDYHDTYGSLPPAIVTDDTDRPLYSWRVLLLPYFDRQDLYDQFDLSQPWDSETNQRLVQQMPAVFESPYLDRSENPGMTSYLAVIDPLGKQTVMLPQEGRSLDELPCELGAVGVVVEQTNHPVIWTKPDDISPFRLIGRAKIEQNDHSYFPVLCGDASVYWIPSDDPQQLRECLLCDEMGNAEEEVTEDQTSLRIN